MIRLFKVAAVFVCAVSLTAFASNATGTLTDTDGSAWSNCTFSTTLTIVGADPAVTPTISGVPVSPLTVTGSCSASGVLAATLTDTSTVDQANAQWVFKVVPNASVPQVNGSSAATTVSTAVVGASPSLTTAFNHLTPPRFAAGSGAYGYADAEVLSPIIGSTYYNVTTPCLRQYSLAGWTCGGGSPNSLNNQGAYASGTTYAVNDVVTASGSYYVSLVADNIGNPPATSPTQWGAISATGGTVTASSVMGAIGGAPGLIPFGDSISAATGAANYSLGFVSLERNQIGGRFYDGYYYPGDMVLDMNKWLHQAGSPFPGGPNTQIEIGTNDVTSYGSSANLQTVFQRVFQESLLWGGISAANKVFAQTCTKTTGFATADNNFLYGLGQSSTTNGDVLTCPVTTGPNGDIALGYLITNGGAGTFTVKVNGVTQNDPYTGSSTWLAYGDGSSTITTSHATTTGFAGAVLTGFPANTSATVVFTVTSPTLSTNVVEPAWIGKFPASSTANPYVIVVSPNHQNNANDALSGTYAGYESAAVTAALGYGLNAIYANTRDGMVSDPLCGNGSVSTMYTNCYADAIHPNGPTATTGGHASMSRIIIAALPAALVTNSPANLFLGQFNTYQLNAGTPVTPMNMPNLNPYHIGDAHHFGPGLGFGGGGGNVSWMSWDPVRGIYMATQGGNVSVCFYPTNSNAKYPSDPFNLVCPFQMTSNGTIDMSLSGLIKTKLVSTSLFSSITSATTINPFGGLFHISGTAAIDTMNPPFTAGCLQIIPDGAWTTTTAGNFALATTAVVGKLLTACYDGTKWYPSY